LVSSLASFIEHGWFHYVAYAILIFFFSYFWVATQFQPQQIADDLKKAGGYIPGVRPGKPTADFLDNFDDPPHFAGAVFLTIIALPAADAQPVDGIPPLAAVLRRHEHPHRRRCVLDTMRQIETPFAPAALRRLPAKGKLRGRFDRTPEQRGETSPIGAHHGFPSVCAALSWRALCAFS
jgi:preprotein translocase subunit SecY